MLFRRSFVGVAALAAVLAACNAPLPEAISPDPADPAAPTTSAPYRPVLAGTAAHGPVGLKPWGTLNEDVAPRAGRSP
jgi:hypothetical protein